MQGSLLSLRGALTQLSLGTPLPTNFGEFGVITSKARHLCLALVISFPNLPGRPTWCLDTSPSLGAAGQRHHRTLTVSALPYPSVGPDRTCVPDWRIF